MIYTKTDSNKFFLNDKNIAQELNYGDIQINAIPSLDLVSSLYNELSTKDNNISLQVDINRTNDKLELSNTLSTYTDKRVLNLSTSLSTQVNKEFVHVSGDTITGPLSIANQLTVDGNVTLKKNATILNNLTQGKGSYVNNQIDRGIAMGISACANKNDAFVWNGDYSVEVYTAQDDKAGSFNINPKDGTQGFYIGTQNISSIIKNDVALTANTLSTYSNSLCSELSLQIEKNRTSDKVELSNILSTYSNSLSNALCTTVDIRRVEDKKELSNVLSTYANNLCTEISNQIVDSRFAYCTNDTVKFWYQSSSDIHALWFELSGINDSKVQISVDTTAFIKDRILKKAEVCYNEETPPVLVLRLYWNNVEPSIGEYTDIKIADLAKIYKAGKGIQITEDLSVSVIDYDGIIFCLNQTSSNVDTLSNTTIPAYTTRLVSLEDYTKKLSSTYTDGGIIATLCVDLRSLSNNISSDVKALSNTTINVISVNLLSALSHNSRLQAYADQLSGASGWIGDIPYLSNILSATRAEIRGAANFCGYVKMNKYQPDWVEEAGNNYISSLFKYAINHGTENAIKNGNIYEIVFQEHPTVEPAGTFVMTNPIYAADQYYDTTDHIRLAHNSFLVVSRPDGSVEIPLTEINSDTVRVIAGDWYVPYMLSVINNRNTAWISGYNTCTSEVDISITTNLGVPALVKTTGHAISGNNEIGGHNTFLEGGNSFEGMNNISYLSVDKLSANYLSGYRIDADQISAYNLSANQISTNSLSTDKLSAYDADVYDLSVGSNAKITGNLSVNNKLTADNSNLNIKLSTNIDNDLYVKNSITLNDVLTANSTQTKIVNLSVGKISANFANIYDSAENAKYNTLNTFETSVELSTSNLCAYVKNIQNKINNIYNQVSSIEETSDLSDIISTVVNIAHGLSDILNVKFQ